MNAFDEALLIIRRFKNHGYYPTKSFFYKVQNFLRKKSEERLYTKEDVLKLCKSAFIEGSCQEADHIGNITFENWVKRNLQ